MADPASVTADPIRAVRAWHAEAEAHPAIRYAHSACLATLDAGHPDARIVLIHAFRRRHLLFGTDVRSAKAHQLASCQHAALVLYWEPLERQVRMRGRVDPGDAADADLTFDERPRDSRITAWASQQGHAVSSRSALEARWRDAAARFESAEVIPRPTTWRAFRFIPEEIELWQARHHRLHERTLFTHAPDGHWRATVLEP